MTTRLLLIAAMALFIVGWIAADRLEHRRHDPVRVVTTNGTTPTTAWPEPIVALPDNFDPVALTPTTAPRPKARTAPTARGVRIAAAPVTADVATLQAIIRDGFARFGAAVAEEAVRVAGCESTGDETGQHLDPNATGSEGEVGLLQLHPRYQSGRAAKFGWTMHDLYDPYKNVVVAADLYAERGWQPWTCRYAA